MAIATVASSGFLFVSESQRPRTESRKCEGAPALEDSAAPGNRIQQTDAGLIPEINLRASLKRDS